MRFKSTTVIEMSPEQENTTKVVYRNWTTNRTGLPIKLGGGQAIGFVRYGNK